MNFEFNIYSTPLLFGFVQGWVYVLLFWRRAWKNERLSDFLFGALLMALTFEIWEYMLGFGGVEFLWRELEFFPRNFSLLLPSLVYFYVKVQFNTRFKFRKEHLVHALPFLIYTTYHLVIFARGPQFVTYWKDTYHDPLGGNIIQTAISFVLEVAYLAAAYRLYRQYRSWLPQEMSDTETMSFSWLRNFLLVFLLSSIFSWGMTAIDLVFHLDFWNDWWDELAEAVMIYYLCIEGYAQTQPRQLHFEPEPEEKTPAGKTEKISEPEMAALREKLLNLVSTEKLYLQPDLVLSDLARKLDTNSSVLSAVINRSFGKNFNDFINEYRVKEFQNIANDPACSHLSILGMGFECGFNSKSTFNRAVKKVTGKSPTELV